MKLSSLKRKDLLRRCVPFPLRQAVRAIVINRVVGSLLARVLNDKIRHRGCVLDTSCPRIRPEDKAALFFHLYERSEIDQIATYVEPGCDVVELGGSIGASSMEIMKQAGRDATVIIIEADSELCAINRVNLVNNFNGCHAVIVNAAVDYSGRTEVEFAASSVDSKVGHVVGPHGGIEGTITVPTITLGQIVKKYNLDRFILVADIEGAEVGLFRKDCDALSRCWRIIIEMDGGHFEGRYYSINALIELAAEQHFTVVHQHGNRIVLENTLLSCGKSL